MEKLPSSITPRLPSEYDSYMTNYTIVTKMSSIGHKLIADELSDKLSGELSGD